MSGVTIIEPLERVRDTPDDPPSAHAAPRGHWVLLSARMPPSQSGVGDYTYYLGRELARHATVSIVTSADQRGEEDGRFRVLPVMKRWDAAGTAALVRVIRQLRPTVINVQWVPFLWDRRGINIALPAALLALSSAGYRIVTTIHEPYVPFDTWSRLIVGPIQRVELATLMLASDTTAVTTSAWTSMLQKWCGWKRDRIVWMPVGSNIPRVPMSAEERARLRRQLDLSGGDLALVTFNPLGGGKLVDGIFRAWDAIRSSDRNARLIVIGATADEIRARRPTAVIERVSFTGYASPHDVSTLLSCSDLLLAPFVDGVSARRTSVISAMAHGVPVVTTRGHLTDPELFDASPLLLADASDGDAFAALAARAARDGAWREDARHETAAFYERHFAWPSLVNRLLTACADGPRA